MKFISNFGIDNNLELVDSDLDKKLLIKMEKEELISLNRKLNNTDSGESLYKKQLILKLLKGGSRNNLQTNLLPILRGGDNESDKQQAIQAIINYTIEQIKMQLTNTGQSDNEIISAVNNTQNKLRDQIVQATISALNQTQINIQELIENTIGAIQLNHLPPNVYNALKFLNLSDDIDGGWRTDLFPEAGKYPDMLTFYDMDDGGNIIIDRNKFKAYIDTNKIEHRPESNTDQIMDMYRSTSFDCNNVMSYIEVDGAVCALDKQAIEFDGVTNIIFDGNTSNKPKLYLYNFSGVWNLKSVTDNSDQIFKIIIDQSTRYTRNETSVRFTQSLVKSSGVIDKKIDIEVKFIDETHAEKLENAMKKTIDKVVKQIQSTLQIFNLKDMFIEIDSMKLSIDKFKDTSLRNPKDIFKPRRLHVNKYGLFYYFDGNNMRGVFAITKDNVVITNKEKFKKDFREYSKQINDNILDQFYNMISKNITDEWNNIMIIKVLSKYQLPDNPYIYIFLLNDDGKQRLINQLPYLEIKSGGGDNKTHLINLNTKKILDIINFFSPYEYRDLLDVPFLSYIYFQKQKNPYHLAIYYSIVDGDHSCEAYIVNYINKVFKFPKDLHYKKLNSIPRYKKLIKLFYTLYDRHANQSKKYIKKVIKIFVKQLKRKFVVWCKEQGLLLLDNKNRDVYNIEKSVLSKKDIDRYIWVCAMQDKLSNI